MIGLYTLPNWLVNLRRFKPANTVKNILNQWRITIVRSSKNKFTVQFLYLEHLLRKEILFTIPLPQDLFAYSHSIWGTVRYHGNNLREVTLVGLFVLLHVHIMGCGTAYHSCCSLFRFMRLHICNVKNIFICIPVEVNSVMLFRLEVNSVMLFRFIWSCGVAICST